MLFGDWGCAIKSSQKEKKKRKKKKGCAIKCYFLGLRTII